MLDAIGREIRYLRLSVTEHCNLRCRYCAPEAVFHTGTPALTVAEITEIAAAAIDLGLDKIRITGGEPLLRPDVLDICRRVAALPGLTELCMTTNGVLLADYAARLRDAGVQRVNISLDTLKTQRFRALTRGGELDQVRRGIAAAETAGLTPIKLNVVLMGGENDDEIPDFVALTQSRPIRVRFIELMPIGKGKHLSPTRFLSGDAVPAACPTLRPDPQGGGDAAHLYRLPGGVGTVELIRPMSRRFCARCNRVRVTADGKLKPCLHSDHEIPLRDLRGAALTAALRAGIKAKPGGHTMDGCRPSESRRDMYQIGG